MAGVTRVRDQVADHLLTPANAALVLIDYQPEQFGAVSSRSEEEITLNVTALARAAKAYDVPVVLTTVGVEMGANKGTIPEILQELPGVVEIDRTTLNSWEDPDFKTAVETTGRQKLIMGGLWTEVCLAFPALDALREGYEVFAVSDAVGGVSADSHERAMQRMIQAGAHPVTAVQVAAELQRDWGRDNADQLRQILRWYFPQAQQLSRGR
jgi:nicotinamidase-related amidase